MSQLSIVIDVGGALPPVTSTWQEAACPRCCATDRQMAAPRPLRPDGLMGGDKPHVQGEDRPRHKSARRLARSRKLQTPHRPGPGRLGLGVAQAQSRLRHGCRWAATGVASTPSVRHRAPAEGRSAPNPPYPESGAVRTMGRLLSPLALPCRLRTSFGCPISIHRCSSWKRSPLHPATPTPSTSDALRHWRLCCAAADPSTCFSAMACAISN